MYFYISLSFNCFSERPLGFCVFLASRMNGWAPGDSPATPGLLGLRSSQFPTNLNIKSKFISFLNFSMLPKLGSGLEDFIPPGTEGLQMIQVMNALPSRTHSWLRLGTNHMSGEIRFSARILGPSWN